jgi:hypothetical protein
MESVAVRRQTRPDRTIGVVYLLYFAAAIGATLLGKGLLSPNDPAATANAMLAHESLYRASLAADLIANALYIGVIALLYALFVPVSQRLSVAAAFFGLVGCSVQIFGNTFRMASLFLLGSKGWLISFTAEQVHSAALLCLRLHALTFNTSLVLFALFNLCIGCLILGSKLLPRFLGVLMLAAGLGWSTFIWPPLAMALSSYIMPLGALAELLLMLWLLVRGAKSAA